MVLAEVNGPGMKFKFYKPCSAAKDRQDFKLDGNAILPFEKKIAMACT